MRKKILVTGGAGYIGSHTVVELYNAGYAPIILDDFSNSERTVIQGINAILEDEIKWYEGDCRDPEFVNNLIILEKDISGVIHFAASKAVGESVEKPLKYYDNNLGSLIKILSSMKKASVNNMVFSSSCTVYGQAKQLPVTEKTPVLPPESPYGSTKQISEEILRNVARSDSQLNCISLRYFNPIGAHPSSQIGELPLGIPSNLVPFITQTAIGMREKLIVFGNNYNTKDGTCIRDYIHVVDLAKAHVKAMDALFDSRIKGYEVLNCGTGEGHTVLELIKTFEEVTGVKVNHEIGPRREGDVESIYADVQKAEKELNWRAELTMSQALKDAYNWQLSLKK